jgi:NAD(P)-dependent dehydrogenase (short-subunit alcohol dehydrogenase family)
MADMRLQGKVAVITGGARGFGRAAARLFASEGAAVVIGDLLEEEGARVVADIERDGGDARFAHVDVTRPADVERLVGTAETAFGKLDVAIANVGILVPATVEDYEEEQFHSQMDVNVKGAWLVCKYALPAMRRAGGGAIVMTASGAALRGTRMGPLYSASKAAVMMLGKSTALAVARDGIRVNVVAPGPVATDLFPTSGIDPVEFTKQTAPNVPMGRLGEPIEIAKAMLFLASDDASWITGTVLSVDGGYTL